MGIRKLENQLMQNLLFRLIGTKRQNYCVAIGRAEVVLATCSEAGAVDSRLLIQVKGSESVGLEKAILLCTVCLVEMCFRFREMHDGEDEE